MGRNLKVNAGKRFATFLTRHVVCLDYSVSFENGVEVIRSVTKTAAKLGEIEEAEWNLLCSRLKNKYGKRVDTL